MASLNDNMCTSTFLYMELILGGIKFITYTHAQYSTVSTSTRLDGEVTVSVGYR